MSKSCGDPTNERWLVLRYQDEDGRLIEQVLSRGMLHKGKELLRHLDTHGLSCSADPEAEGLLVHYLKQLDRHSRRLRAVTRTGWDADTGLFIFPTGEVFGDDTSEDRAGVKLANPRRGRAWSRGGSLEGWQQQLAALAIGNSRLALAVCTPFAATLLYFAEGSESGGVHFDGASSIGKSSLQRAAASVFGLGASGEGLVLPWAGTSKGMSAYAALFTDLPFVLDEIGQAKPAEVARIVMNVSNGAGTVAALGSGGARELPWWRTLMISSGNHAVEDIIGQNSEFDIQAIRVRLLNIPSEVKPGTAFEQHHGFADGGAFADYIRAMAVTHYGHAGWTWLTRLTAEVNADPAGFRLMLNSRLRAFCKTYEASAAGVVRRGVQRFALAAAAGELAIEWGILPWPAGEAKKAAAKCLKAWQRWVEGRSTDHKAKVLAHLREWMFANPTKFANHLAPETRSGLVGYYEDKVDGRYYYIVKERWPEVTKGLDGISPQEAIEMLNAQSLLLRAKPKGLLHKKSPRGLGPGMQVQVYVVLPRAFQA